MVRFNLSTILAIPGAAAELVPEVPMPRLEDILDCTDSMSPWRSKRIIAAARADLAEHRNNVVEDMASGWGVLVKGWNLEGAQLRERIAALEAERLEFLNASGGYKMLYEASLDKTTTRMEQVTRLEAELEDADRGRTQLRRFIDHFCDEPLARDLGKTETHRAAEEVIRRVTSERDANAHAARDLARLRELFAARSATGVAHAHDCICAVCGDIRKLLTCQPGAELTEGKGTP